MCENEKSNIELISLLIDDELCLKDKEKLLLHISECETCSKTYDNLLYMVELLNDIPDVELPKDFHDEAMYKIKCSTSSNKNISRQIKIVNFKEQNNLNKEKENKKFFNFGGQFLNVASSIVAVLFLVAVVGGTIFNSLNVGKIENFSSMAIVESEDSSQMTGISRASFDETNLPSEKKVVVNDGGFNNLTGKIVTKNYSITIETDNFDEDLKKIEQLGLITSSKSSQNYNDSKNYNINFEVSEDDYLDSIKYFNGIGEITFSSSNESDLTDDYNFQKIRSSNILKETDNLIMLMGKSADLTDLIKVQTRLGELQLEREQVLGNVKYYEKSMGKNTISINLVENNGKSNFSKLTFGEKMLDSFNKSGIFVANIAYSGILLLAKVLLPILLIFILPFLMFKFVKRGGKNGKAKK